MFICGRWSRPKVDSAIQPRCRNTSRFNRAASTCSPDYTVQIDKEGKWTATQVFLCYRARAAKLMSHPANPHPEILFIA